MQAWRILVLITVAVVAFAVGAGAEVDREKLLKEPGVYATFAVFKVGDQWPTMDKQAKAGAVEEVKKVFQMHADRVSVDTHLVRGLSEKADFFLRVHSKEMKDNQNFLVDFMSTSRADRHGMPPCGAVQPATRRSAHP